MKRTPISIAIITAIATLAALSNAAQASAADKPTAAGTANKLATTDATKLALPPVKATVAPAPKKPATDPGTPAAPSTAPTLATAVFTLADNKALQFSPLKLDGLNIGAGMNCDGTVQWGDGTSNLLSLGLNGLWLSLDKKAYAKAGKYTVVITPKAPCITNRPNNAPITADLTVSPPTPLPPSTISELSVTAPRGVQTGFGINKLKSNEYERLIDIKWNNGGHATTQCGVIVHYGDGTDSAPQVLWSQQATLHLTHIYKLSDLDKKNGGAAYSVIVSPTNSDYDSCSLGPNAGPKTFTLQ